MTDEEKRERQKASMRKYYHKTAKFRPYEGSCHQRNQGWTFNFVGNNLKLLHEIHNIV